MPIIVAVPDEPLPSSPEGKSAALKLGDWRALARLLPAVDLRVVCAGALRAAPQIVESFLPDAHLLSAATVPRSADHAFFEDIRAYWPQVMKAGIPVIPVLPAGQAPTHYPVFVRGRAASFRSTRRVRSRRELPALTPDLIIRPYVEIERCGRRPSVTKELRVHLVFGVVCCIEFLFPEWAGQRPTPAESQSGLAWARAAVEATLAYGRRLADVLNDQWVCADFAQTADGLRLIELNAGWCSGVTHPATARAVHLGLLQRAFNVPAPDSLWLKADSTAVWVASHAHRVTS